MCFITVQLLEIKNEKEMQVETLIFNSFELHVKISCT